VPELTPQTEARHAPGLPPLPPTHSGSGGRQVGPSSPSFAACPRGCSWPYAPSQDNDGRRRTLAIIGPHLEGDMTLDLFAGIAVSDYATALPWYEQFFGRPPSFLPTDTEAVWQVADHGYIYIVQQPERAGHALVLSFVDDLEDRVAKLSQRGIQPASRETFDNGVTKVSYRDAEGNEISFGGGPG
jgi:hypothetical protein